MAQSTPVKVYSFAEDICELCGFSFVQTIVDPDGFKIVNKKYTQKLKLTDQKTENVVKVLPDFIPSPSSKNGICLKCNRTIEKVIKLEEELLHIRGNKTSECCEYTNKHSIATKGYSYKENVAITTYSP